MPSDNHARQINEHFTSKHRVFEPAPEAIARAHLSRAGYDQMTAHAAADYPGYWAKLARDCLVWHRPFTQALDESNAPFYKWFADGLLNASYNCLDRHLQTIPNRVAVIFEADDGRVTRITYKELYHRVCELANGLKSLGVAKGDRILIYLRCPSRRSSPCRPAPASAPSTSVVFGGFSAKSVNERIADAGAKLVITIGAISPQPPRPDSPFTDRP